MWTDLFVALSLVMVIEGILPFLNPPTMRRMLLTVASQDDRALRLIGFVSMLTGVIMLYAIK